MDCTDFDVVASGPLARDLARAACGLAIAEDQRRRTTATTRPTRCRTRPRRRALARVALLATAWAERLLTGQGGLPGAGAFARHLAATETPAGDVKLDESTHVGEPITVDAPLAAAAAGYFATTPAAAGGRVVRAFRLHGKGASSFCVDRVILLLELPAGDRHVVEWKPQPDAPTVHQAFRERRSPATRDPFLGLTAVDGVGHVVQRWLVDAQKVRAKDLKGDYADAVARLVAVRLAELHRRSVPEVVARLRGQPLPTIAEALADLVAAAMPVLAAEWRAFVAVAPTELVRRVGG